MTETSPFEQSSDGLSAVEAEVVEQEQAADQPDAEVDEAADAERQRIDRINEQWRLEEQDRWRFRRR